MIVFSPSSTRFIHSYLFERKQRTKINSVYSWEEIISKFPQDFVLESILFNAFICDLFSVVSNIDFESYADDNVLYVIRENTKEVIEALKNSFEELMQWFSNNQMKANADKCFL